MISQSSVKNESTKSSTSTSSVAFVQLLMKLCNPSIVISLSRSPTISGLPSLLTKKTIKSSEKNNKINPRARSAKLRAAEKNSDFADAA